MPTCTHPEAYAHDTDELVCVKCGEVVVDDDLDWSERDEDEDMDDWLDRVTSRRTSGYDRSGRPVINPYYHYDPDTWFDRLPWWIGGPLAALILLVGGFLLAWLLS